MIVIRKDGTHFVHEIPLGAERALFRDPVGFIEWGAWLVTLRHDDVCPKSRTEPRGRVALEEGTDRDRALALALSLIPCADCCDGRLTMGSANLQRASATTPTSNPFLVKTARGTMPLRVYIEEGQEKRRAIKRENRRKRRHARIKRGYR